MRQANGSRDEIDSASLEPEKNACCAQSKTDDPSLLGGRPGWGHHGHPTHGAEQELRCRDAPARLLSRERLHPYQAAADNGDRRITLARYLRNAALTADITPTLHALEVALRNA